MNEIFTGDWLVYCTLTLGATMMIYVALDIINIRRKRG